MANTLKNKAIRAGRDEGDGIRYHSIYYKLMRGIFFLLEEMEAKNTPKVPRKFNPWKP